MRLALVGLALGRLRQPAHTWVPPEKEARVVRSVNVLPYQTLFRGAETPASDLCLFFEGGCAFAEETCGGLLSALDRTQPCAAFMHRVHGAYQKCELDSQQAGFRTEGFVNCFYETLPTPSCESVCVGLPDEHCGVRCRQFKVCSANCRNVDRKYMLDTCFTDCFSGSVFHPVATCANRCNGHAADASCYCDEPCLLEGDCCPDYEVACRDGAVAPLEGDALAAAEAAIAQEKAMPDPALVHQDLAVAAGAPVEVNFTLVRAPALPG